LESLEVSHDKIELVVKTASAYGLHAKLTGAGGGGFVYILIPPDVEEDLVEELKLLLKKENFICCETTMGVDGVRISYQQS